jgi:hypothetical protein
VTEEEVQRAAHLALALVAQVHKLAAEAHQREQRAAAEQAEAARPARLGGVVCGDRRALGTRECREGAGR